MPLITREVRWFFDGSLAATGAETAAWFAGTGTGGESCFGTPIWPQDWWPQDWRHRDWRTDHYLRLPNANDVGMKLRQGQLEIKGCHSFVGVQRFGDGVEGEVACWTKWAVDPPEREGGADGWLALEGLATLPIAKQRMQRSVRFTQGGVVEVPVGQQVDHGMHMELTRLRVAGAPEETHWSLGFEAFPDSSSCCASFAEAVSRLLTGCPAKPLGAANSMSYPRWLQRLGAGELRRPE